MARGLFRQESIGARRSSYYGRVQLALPISHKVWSLLAAFAGSLIISFLIFGQYTRRERVSGALKPQGGMISVTSRTNGTVSRIAVSEGTHVDAGDILIEMSGERSSRTKGNATEAIGHELDYERTRIENDIADIRNLSEMQGADLRVQESMLMEQISRIASQEALAAVQAKSMAGLLTRIEPLTAKGYISAFDIHQHKMNKLNAESKVKDLQRQHFELSQQRHSVRNQVEQLPLTTNAKISELRRELTLNERSTVQNELDRVTTIQASQAGIVTSIIVAQGQVIASGDGLLAIVPDGAPLHAELLVPSRAMGFIHKGMTVGLHYEAYPYQKFGTQKGRVSDISRVALTQRELSGLLGGRTYEEPMYRVFVAPESQDIPVYEGMEHLRAGMALDADMFLDRRRVVEWIMEPLYAAHHRTEVLE